METRLEHRVKIACQVEMSIADDPGQRFALSQDKALKVEVMDISKVGMGMISSCYFPKGLIIELQIDGAQFGLKELMRLKAEVRWCNYIKPSVYRFGVRFIHPPDIYVQAVSKFVSEHERRKEPRLKISD